MKLVISFAGSWKSARFALAFALLFAVGSFGFYACTSTSGSEILSPPKNLNNIESTQPSIVMSDFYDIITGDNVTLDFDPGSPSCSCSNWGCSAQGFCTDGRTCACTCTGFFGTCGCTVCQRVLTNNYRKSQIIMTEKHRQTRLTLEKYLFQQNNVNLLQTSKLLTEIRLALEAKDIDAYFATTAKAKEFEKKLSWEEKNIIQKWFTENNFGVIVQ